MATKRGNRKQPEFASHAKKKSEGKEGERRRTAAIESTMHAGMTVVELSCFVRLIHTLYIRVSIYYTVTASSIFFSLLFANPCFLSPLRKRQDERLEKSALGLTAPFGRYHISRDFSARFTFCFTYVDADKNGRTSWGVGRKLESARKRKT